MEKDVKERLLIFILGFVIGCVVIYSCYWFFKVFSYWLFYEDMVKQTINEVVKSIALK